jgi:hypothetical protein
MGHCAQLSYSLYKDNKCLNLEIAHCTFAGSISQDLALPFFFVSTEGTQGLPLARQALYRLNHSASPVLSWVFFKIGSHELFTQASNGPCLILNA